MSRLGALCLSPVCLSKVWAAPRLPSPWSDILAAPPRTGEVWLCADRHHVTPVARGPLAGQGLDQVMAEYGQEILGAGAEGGFPLLLKVLAVGSWLSVQVHPDDAAARRLEGEPWGKAESWYVLDSEPGSQLIMGLKEGLDHEALRRAVAEGRFTEVLARVEARAGEVFDIPAGTVHAVGPGLTLFEVQQTSDVTYRFYDWDRPGDGGRLRPLHVEQALEVVNLSGPGLPQAPRAILDQPGFRVDLLVATPHFELRRYRLEQKGPLAATPSGPRVLFVMAGRTGLSWERGEGAVMEPGQTWLLPAALEGVSLTPLTAEVQLLESAAT